MSETSGSGPVDRDVGQPITAPLQVLWDWRCHGIDGRARVAVADHTPARNVAGYMLPADAVLYVALRNAGESVTPNAGGEPPAPGRLEQP